MSIYEYFEFDFLSIGSLSFDFFLLTWTFSYMTFLSLDIMTDYHFNNLIYEYKLHNKDNIHNEFFTYNYNISRVIYTI